MNLADLIERNAAFTPDKAAIRFAGELHVLREGGPVGHVRRAQELL
jgi:hypothetical protein